MTRTKGWLTEQEAARLVEAHPGNVFFAEMPVWADVVRTDRERAAVAAATGTPEGRRFAKRLRADATRFENELGRHTDYLTLVEPVS